MRETIDGAFPLPLTLTPAELVTLTGYKIPSMQLQELRRRGFWRACQNRSGKVVIERAHFQAIASAGLPGGAAPLGHEGGDGPKLRLSRREKETKNG